MPNVIVLIIYCLNQLLHYFFFHVVSYPGGGRGWEGKERGGGRGEGGGGRGLISRRERVV